MGCKRTDCLSRPLSGLFEKFGSLVGSYPLYFFVIPLMLTAALGGGFSFLKDREDNDLERQYTPRKGPSKVTRAFAKENFPFNDSMFSEDRLYDQGNFASFIALATNEANILDNGTFEDVARLNSEILDITVLNGTVGFKELCAKANGECVSNSFLEHFHTKGPTGIGYPFHSSSSGPVFLGSVLGGVVTDVKGLVISAQAVKLVYYLEDKESTADATKLWLRGFKNLLSDWKGGKHVEVSYYTSKSKQEEIDSHTTDGVPLFLITYAFAITFSVISCLRLDNVRNKVWVAVFGVFSSGLAIMSSFGLLLYIGVPFVITVANSPFLILGIGLNNMFILVSDWQHTKVKDSVPHRMAHSYKEAVMSITITALTDLVKFSIGVTSDFPAVQSFCVYTSVSIVFCYFYTITFFGSFMALNGRREADNRHWLTCRRIPTDKLDHHSNTYNICCVGGGYDHNTGAEKKQPASNFFKDYYGPFLIKPWVKGAVIFLFVVYLSASIYGCFHVQQGIELYDLAADNSHVTTFNRKDREYFSAYGPTVMVIVSEEFPYWDEAKTQQLQGCIEDFKELQFVDKEIFKSWLGSYYQYGDESHLNLNERDVFLKSLSKFFDSYPFFKQDVNLTGDAIYASRFFIQTVNISDGSKEIQMLHGLTATAEKCDAASLLVYNQKFIFYDQYDVVVYSTIKNVAVITAVMLVVSLLLIPNPICSLWVAVSIGSVTAGVTGFMWLWDVRLDSISMIIFTVCIGFTVDFSAHVSYAFVSSKKSTNDEKAVEAISNLGYPILQGAVSTVLGVSVLATSEFNTFRTFFKIFFLVMFLGMLHGLIFIPVILTLFTRRPHKKEKKELIYTISKH
ncbi:patched domain-containing protein 3-like [Notolabrus celidotus]|uniref:patched domain-containing protein 3-like n=1 Tax=Notolabrus celidotus TaxID=1203425 RepID=UPI0014908007|nr:patched domain-containing protein 3-like [Notolabrus celidotus]